MIGRALLAGLVAFQPVVLAAQAVAKGGLLANSPGRHCGPAEHPAVLPSAGAVLDTAALLHPLGHPARMLLSLRFEDAGKRAVALVLESNQDSAATEWLRAAVESAARVPQPGKSVWSLRVRLEGGSAPALGFEPSVFCPAEPRGRGPNPLVMVTRSDSAAAAGSEDSVQHVPGADRQQIRLAALLHVSAQGVVTDVDLTTRSGQRSTDNQFVASWRRMRFLPALLDGIPVPVSYDTETEQSIPQ